MRNTVNPRVIEWALNRCHKTPEDLKNTVSPRVQQWIEWKDGDKQTLDALYRK